jgi:uncharacterized membrane protein YqiK
MHPWRNRIWHLDCGIAKDRAATHFKFHGARRELIVFDVASRAVGDAVLARIARSNAVTPRTGAARARSPVLESLAERLWRRIMSIFVIAVFALAGGLALFLLAGIRYIPNSHVGIVEKRISTKGSLPTGFIALGGEAGFQPDVLRGGLHYLAPVSYRVHRVPLVTIPQGKMGYVFARDGVQLAPSQALAANVLANDFQDVATFLKSGGQRGPQRQVLREGTYAINLAQFVVLTWDKLYYLKLNRDDDDVFKRMADTLVSRDGFRPLVLTGADDDIGVVTVHDGPALPQGEIIAPTVGDDRSDPRTYHNNFQNADAFLNAGGYRGRQYQVLVDGTYYLNRLFATVELEPKTVVEVGNVGVVVSYTGEAGADLSGTDYKHGELVRPGQRGVWGEPLLPGKYAFNTYAGRVVMVPTTNFILKWNKSEVGAHRYDENLAEVSLITKDAFEPKLPLSVVVHIDYRKAALVVQRFGDVKRLVEQTLDPMVAAYFKNVAQTRTLIQLLQDRASIQRQSGEEMKEKFAHYNLELEEVLIGTPSGSSEDRHIETILAQLRARQVAEEQVETYARQERAALKERELREAEARANQQRLLTESELSIRVQENEGKAEYQRATQQALQIRALSEAEADKLRIMGKAEAERAARVGVAEAIATEEKVRAYGGPRFQVTQAVLGRFSEAVEHSGVDVVPRILVGGGSGGASASGGGVLETLLSLLLSEKLGESPLASNDVERSPEIEALRQELRARARGGLGGNGKSPNG